MTLEELLNEGLVGEFESAPELVKQSIHSAEKDLETAHEVFKMGNFDWAFVIA